jgi:hypothetical protein
LYPVIEKLDFLVRFWELKARHATLGEPLCAREQVELLSLMQLVGDCALPEAGPVARTKGTLPAQVIGDGTMRFIEVRSVGAGALLAACATPVAVGVNVIVRAADAVSGVEYALPCKVMWVYSGTPYTLALVVDGIPSRTVFAAPTDVSLQTAMALGRQERLVG